MLRPQPTRTLAALALATLIAPAAHALTLREQSELKAAMGGVTELRVQNSRGDIAVEPSLDGALHLVATKVIHGATRSELTRMSGETQVEARRIGNQYALTVHYPHGGDLHFSLFDLFHGNADFPNVAVHLRIQVPAGPAVTLRSTSGDQAAHDLSNPVDSQSSSGDVKVEGQRGRLEVSTSSGDIRAVDVGRTRLHTTSGDVTVNGVSGALDVHTSSGTLELHGVSDSLTVSSVSGDVTIEGTPGTFAASSSSGDIVASGLVRGAVHVATTSGGIRLPLAVSVPAARISSGSGDVDLKLERGTNATFDVTTGSGTIDANLGLQVQSATRHVLRGTLGSGRAPIELKTTSGDIRLSSGG